MPKGITCLMYIQVVLTAISSFFSSLDVRFLRSIVSHRLTVLDFMPWLFSIYCIDNIFLRFLPFFHLLYSLRVFQENLQSVHPSFENRNKARKKTKLFLTWNIKISILKRKLLQFLNCIQAICIFLKFYFEFMYTFHF